MPTRMLDVGTKLSGQHVRLVESTSLGRQALYGSLSHCWGKTIVPCLTTKQTIDENKRGIEWDLLPKTFQDAIIVTQKSGIRYIWIDSLCIIQGDEQAWSAEADRVRDYYSNAFVTLAGTWAADDGRGLF
jgi:Heterokaryon incompatibility protein (HET)